MAEQELLENLNEQQLKAVTHINGPLLIIAGAGTGKTTVITRRIAYIIGQKLAKPEQVLALTFTDKAAGEMEDRVFQLLPLGSYDLWISTFHSFCERILKEYALSIGISNDFRLLNETEQWVLIYKNLDKFKLSYYRPLGNPSKFIDALRDHFSKCKDELISPQDYLDYAQKQSLSDGNVELPLDGISEAKRLQEIAHAYHVYQQLLLDNNSLDFGDLINYTVSLFKQRPEILTKFQSQFKFIMVDEFQDTNFAQYELVRLLAGKSAGKTGTSNLVVVGDDDQSIYKFRGASVSNITQFQKDFPDLQQITLIENYRSSQAILDLSYNFIQHNNPNRLEFQFKINKRLNGHNKTKAVIEVIEAETLSQELHAVVEKIWDLKQANLKSNWNDFVILIRANSAAAEILPILESKNIPYTFYANKGLYKKPLINDVINYLKLLDNYHESASLYRVLQFPKFRISPEDLAKLGHFSNKKSISLYESISHSEARAELSENSVEKLDSLLLLLENHSKQAIEKSAIELFVYIIQDLEIDKLLTEETFENSENRELLEQFYKKIEHYSQNEDNRSLRSFIDYLNLEIEAGETGNIQTDLQAGPESLKVMTIHSAKGLEFEHVFIINMVDLRFPTRAKRDPIEIPAELIKDIAPSSDFHIEEERRLFYVALTRAKTHLYLSWAADYGGSKAKRPSLFLEESGLIPGAKTAAPTGKVVFKKSSAKKSAVVYKDLPTNFSYSQINQFLRCPLEYKYRYYLKLPLPGSAALSFGTTIHVTLQSYLELFMQISETSQLDLFGGSKKTSLPPLEKLLSIYELSWIDDWYKNKTQKEEYRGLGKKLLQQFFDYSVSNLPKPKFVEKKFKIDLQIDGQLCFFNGKIDRADNSDHGLKIIDYKTGKIPAKKSSEDIDQLKIYQWACSIMGYPVSSLEYWYLENNQFSSVELASTQELENLKSALSETILEIRNTVKEDSFVARHNKSKQHDCTFLDFG